MKTFTKITVVVFLSTLAVPVLADQDASLERAQYMLRQVNAQKDQLEQKNAELQKEIDGLKSKSEKQLKEQKLGNKKLGQDNKKKDEYIAKLRDKIKALVATLRESESERLLANKEGLAVNADLKACVDNNHQLVKVNDELVSKYGKKGIWDAMVQKEPFTGIAQTKIENIMQEYRFKNEDLEMKTTNTYKQVGAEENHAPAEAGPDSGS